MRVREFGVALRLEVLSGCGAPRLQPVDVHELVVIHADAAQREAMPRHERRSPDAVAIGKRVLRLDVLLVLLDDFRAAEPRHRHGHGDHRDHGR